MIDMNDPGASKRSVDTMPTPNLRGIHWNWALNGGVCRGWCVVRPFVVEVRVARGPEGHPARPDDYTLGVVVLFSGIEVHRMEERDVSLPQLTPEAVLDAVEKRDMLWQAVHKARLLARRLGEMVAETDAGKPG